MSAGLNLLAGLAQTTGQVVGAVEAERAGRATNRQAKKDQDQVIRASEERADILQEQAQRVATTQRARGGATGAAGFSALSVLETLTASFDTIRALNFQAGVEATRVRKLGRDRRRSASAVATAGFLSAGATAFKTFAKLAEDTKPGPKGPGTSRVKQD